MIAHGPLVTLPKHVINLPQRCKGILLMHLTLVVANRQ